MSTSASGNVVPESAMPAGFLFRAVLVALAFNALVLGEVMSVVEGLALVAYNRFGPVGEWSMLGLGVALCAILGLWLTRRVIAAERRLARGEDPD